MKAEPAAGRFYNINLPYPLNEGTNPAYRFCELEKQPHAYSYIRNSDAYLYSGSIHDRPRDPGTDVDVCFQGMISVTCLDL
jgi:5'-nucleotidase